MFSLNDTDERSDAVTAEVTTRRPGAVKPVTDLTATAEGSDAIRLKWTLPVGSVNIDSFLARYGKGELTSFNKKDFPFSKRNNNTATEVLITGLDPLTKYSFIIITVSDTGDETPSSIVTSVTEAGTDKPSAPRNLRAALPMDSLSVTLTWDAPSDNGSSAIINYAVYEGSTQLTETTKRGFVHALTAENTYSYTVTAINSQGESPKSNLVTVKSKRSDGGSDKPSAPLNLQATLSADSLSATLTWDVPSDNGSSAITDYVVYDGSTRLGLVTDRSFVHALTAGKIYLYTVTAINSQGESPKSNLVLVYGGSRGGGGGGGGDSDKPSAPLNLQAVLSADSLSATLTWDAPSDSGSSAIINYVVYDGSTQLAETTDRSYVHALIVGNIYLYTVAAINSQGEGPKSSAVIVKSDGRKYPPSKPLNLTATSPNQTEIVLTWATPTDDGGSPIIGYHVAAAFGKGGIFGTLIENTGVVNTYKHTGLSPGTEIRYKVRAINEVGAGAYSNIAEAITEHEVPDPPWDLRAKAEGTRAIRLDWKPPIYTGGLPIIAYRIEIFIEGTWLVLESRASPHSTTYLHSDLEPGTKMTYQVTAINKQGASESSSIATAQTAVTVPNPPMGLTATATEPDRIRLEWDAPEDHGGSGITGYKVEAMPEDGSWIAVTTNTRSSRRSYTHSGLKPASKWFYQISAINEAGLSRPSEIASGRTLAIVPDQPTELSSKAIGSDEIQLRWSAPAYNGGSQITGYRIEFSDTDQASWTDLVENSKTMHAFYAHTRLEPASTFHYRVSAINDMGVGRPSAVTSARTEAMRPDRPANTKATVVDAGTIRIEWSPPVDDGGAEVTSYRIDASYDDGRTWQIIEDNLRRRYYFASELKPATVYHYRVAAINAKGVGEFSDPVSARTDATIPDAPIDLEAEPISPNENMLTWSSPAFNGGATIGSYLIERSHDETEWAKIAEVEEKEHTDENVTPGLETFYRVSAINEAGQSKWSNVASARTDDPRERADRANAAILPRITSVITEDIVTAITDRIEGRRENTLVVSESSGEYSQALGRISSWGRVSRTMMQSGEGVLNWKGGLTSYQLGIDAPYKDRMIAGFMLNRSSGSYTFTDDTNDRAIEGTHVAYMNNFAPYLGWSPREALSIWLGGSYGGGNLKIEDELAGSRDALLTMSMKAVGMVGRLRSGFVFKAEGWQSTIAMKDTEHFSETTVEIRRVRGMLEWTRSLQAGLDLVLNGGLRFDMNLDTENVNGFETGGGFVYRRGNLMMKARGRALIATETGYEEWGASGSLEINPDAGFSIAVSPSVGEGESNVESIWANGIRTGFEPLGNRLNVVAGYKSINSSVIPFGRFNSLENKFVLGTRMEQMVDWIMEGGYSPKGLTFSLRGSQKF